MSLQRLPEGCDVPGPEQVGIHEPVETSSCGIVLGTRGAHDGVGRQVNARTGHLPQIELADTGGVQDRDLDVEATGARRIIRWKSSDGEEAEMIASKRLPYWQLNSSAGETELKGLGLKPVAR